MHRLTARALCGIAIILSVLSWSACSALAQTDPTPAKAPYRILVTNDDGVDSPGLAAIVEALSPLGELTIVAPLQNQSGIGHALNLRDPIFVGRRKVAEFSAIALSATPATCVRVALEHYFSEGGPDLVVSGANRGVNFGRNTYISGTVAAAREAAIHGIPAIAVSLAIEAYPEFAEAAVATAEVAAIVKANGLPSGIFLNVSVPAPPAKGLKLSRQSQLAGSESFDARKNPYGRPYLWSFFEQPTGEAELGSDVAAFRDGYIAVTPLRASEADESAFDALAVHFPGVTPAIAAPSEP